jgi:small-conductance mechanosensitive channel
MALPRFLATPFLLFACALLAAAQEAPTPAKPAPSVPSAVPTPSDPALRNAPAAMQTLETLQVAITNLREQLRIQRSLLKKTEVESEQLAVTRTIDDLATRLTQLERDFRAVATGIDLAEFQSGAEQSFQWNQQIQELLQPLLSEMRQATSESREMEILRNIVSALERRRALALRASANVTSLLERSENPALTHSLNLELATWQTYLAETQGQLEATRYQLAERVAANPSVFNRISSSFAGFFRSRGMNLLVALGIFVGVIVVSRRIHQLAHRRAARRTTESGFSLRLLNLIFYGVVIAGAIFAALVSLYLADDWVLLTLAVIFLVAIAWGLKNTIPSMIEQIRTLLNLGSIREGERVIYAGLPWKVGPLNIFTHLTNPSLEGAVIRLSIRELKEMISRPWAPSELWFPCEKDDWVVLADGTYGKVVQQNPDFVQVIQLGGIRRTYPTASFLGQTPQNLSHNFRVAIIFGLDYRHQADATREIPELLKKDILAGLVGQLSADAVLSLRVEFSAAASSSLDYEIMADFCGELAPRYRVLRRSIQALAVECCNRHSWIIPFNQVTVHQGAAS